jgi:DNA-binding transcriptional LysR family regulator
MNIKKYEVFLKIAELGTFTKVGEVMGYTQSGISHIVKSLEAEMGFPLFQRASKGIILNDNGKRLLPLVRNVLLWSEQLQQTISSINGLVTGSIGIGTFSSISIHWLPKIIKEFQRDYPQIHISLYEGGIQEIDDWLMQGVVDIAFFSRQSHHFFEWIALKEDPLLAVLPMDYPFPDKQYFPVENFNGAPFIISTAGFDYDIHRVLEQSNITAEVKFSSKDDDAIISMVEHGLGITILPELILGCRTHNVKALKLEPEFFRSLGIALPSMDDISPAAKKFLEYAKLILKRDKLL